jgi:hypothetical protein
MLGGTAIAVGLPFLDNFLDDNGTALAASGGALPTCFGTWFWGLGFNPGQWEPKTAGEFNEFGPELAALDPLRKKINVFSGMKVHLDGKPNTPHMAGVLGLTTGAVLGTAPSLDQLIADVIGARTRFRSIEVACTGNPSHSVSRRSATVLNPAEVSPLALYSKIFGKDFKDPNAAEFTPDTQTMVRLSVLSAVTNERQAFIKELGASDQARLDQYFTSLRELEQKLALELEKPAPLEACSIPGEVAVSPVGTEIGVVTTNHTLFSGLLAHALACGQTRVINLAYANANSSVRKPGGLQTHHEFTHEEPVDPVTGVQTEMTEFYHQLVASFAEFLTTLDGIREGDRTLLDRTVIYATSDTGYAKTHSQENIPILTAGSASGRIKTGIHVRASGDPGTRVGLTIQQALGVPVDKWGFESMGTSKTVTDILS